MLKEGVNKILNSKSKIFFSFCFCFLIGIFVISIFDFKINLFYLSIVIIILISFVIIFFDKKFFVFILFCILFVLLAFLRYDFFQPKNNSNHISFYNQKEKVVKAYISSEPDIRLDGIRYILNTSEIILNNNQSNKVKGKIYLKSGLYPRYNYGDELLLKCKLITPEPIEDFRYDKYLARYKVYSVCQIKSLKKLGENKANLFLNYIFSFKNIIAKKINKLWHDPEASFMAGLLYGYRGGLGSLNEKFNTTGVTHIVAISGYNISLIASILLAFCLSFYIPRKKSFYLVISGIIIFVIFAGASASVVRAGIMGIIVLFAKQIGRNSNVNNVLILTAVVMSIINPYILVWDAGFQLSFLATMGLIYLSPILLVYFKKVPKKFSLQESLVSTLAAIIITLPLILYQFGRLSIVAPMVNILILWILPWIMLFGFFAVLFSFIFQPLALVLSFIAWLMMEYILKVVTFFAELPFASVQIKFNIFLSLFFYLLIILFIYKNKDKI